MKVLINKRTLSAIVLTLSVVASTASNATDTLNPGDAGTTTTKVTITCRTGTKAAVQACAQECANNSSSATSSSSAINCLDRCGTTAKTDCLVNSLKSTSN